LGEATDLNRTMALSILSHILLGMPGSPLRKALIESGLGEDLTGGGLEDELRQLFFSVGLKGVEPGKEEEVERLILTTLDDLSRQGIDTATTEASLNTIEFRLREQNAGSFPRGLVLMLRSLTAWLYDGDPIAPLAFEAPLQALKEKLSKDTRYFEKAIGENFLENSHRTTVILRPDTGLAARMEQRMREILDGAKNDLTEEGVQRIIDGTKRLKELQAAPDTPEALAAIPTLKLADLDRTTKIVPREITDRNGVTILHHDLFTNGVTYADLSFDLTTLPQECIPYAPLYARSLMEMGTEREDYVALSQRIGAKTGGIRTALLTAVRRDSGKTIFRLFLKGKAMERQLPDLFAAMGDLLLTVRLDNRERFRQILLEEKSRLEQALIPSGHQLVNIRLQAHFNEAGWVSETTGGASQLFFLRRLLQDVDSDWPSVLAVLQKMHRIAVTASGIVANGTTDSESWKIAEPLLQSVIEKLPASAKALRKWSPLLLTDHEGLIVPAQINYVGKAADLYAKGYSYHGSIAVMTRYLRTAWLWDRVRVQGGAYGAFCSFDRMTGILSFVSYRDPNLLETLRVFDETADYLRLSDFSAAEVTKGIIGAIGDIDTYQLPDSKGYASMIRYLAGITDEERQRVRDEVLSTTTEDFRTLADILKNAMSEGVVTVLASESAIEAAQKEGELPLKKVPLL
ncbi:MAG: insulinase family protein, partial [Deltaproteobacteria bacterium]|nr:insulinase family protein [Deltaproteobacteria bacterium]